MDVQYKDVVIASGGTDSAEIDLTGGYTLVGVILPATMTGTTIGLKVAKQSGGTYVPIKDGASDVALTSAASKCIYFDTKYTLCARYVKIVSGTSEGADRTVTALYRQIR